MSKPKLCEIFGVEPMEEFKYQDTELFYHVDSSGHVYQKEPGCTWSYLGHQFSLERMIEDGILKLPKKTIINDEQLEALEALVAIFKVDAVYNGTHGVHIVSVDNNQLIYLPKENCLESLFGTVRTYFDIHEAILKGELECLD